MSSDLLFHRDPFRVRAYEAGLDGRASVLTLCDYLQEAAGNHALARGFARLALGTGPEATGVWVLRRLRLEATRLPAWQDTVTVETWASHHQGLRAFREYVVTDDSGAQIAAATSSWFVLDLERRRPARLPSLLSTVEAPERPRPFAMDDRERPPLVSDAEHPSSFLVRHTDLDLNGHANHGRFVEWAMESVPAAYVQTHACMGFDLFIEHEIGSGPLVDVHADTRADGWVHTVRHAGTVLARVATHWVPAGPSRPV
ncbi:MAG: acyl-ACP thioesterase domain-containing protein [Bacteroidota bacterium]